MIIEVCHYPPGTSKWNKIEHRVFCQITKNWQGVPLETTEIVVNSIGSTSTKAGLEVHAWLDEKTYKKGIKVSDELLGEWQLAAYRGSIYQNAGGVGNSGESHYAIGKFSSAYRLTILCH